MVTTVTTMDRIWDNRKWTRLTGSVHRMEDTISSRATDVRCPENTVLTRWTLPNSYMDMLLTMRMRKLFWQVNIRKEVVRLPFNCIDFSNCCLWATTFSTAFFLHSWLQSSVAPGDHITRDRMFINSVDGVSRVTTSPMIIAALLSECNLLSGDQMDYQLCWELSGYQVSSKMYDQY